MLSLIIGWCGIFIQILHQPNNVYADDTPIGTIDARGTAELDHEEILEISDDIPEIYIKAINPGYTVDKISNVGEMIELGRKPSDTPLSLAGIAIGYTNSSGNQSILIEFPENTWFVGETLLLKLASSADEQSNLTYAKTLAMEAGLALQRGDEVLDSVCWTGKENCAKTFKSSKPTTLVRNLTTGEFEHLPQDDYRPIFNSANYKTEPSQSTDDGEPSEELEKTSSMPSQCHGLAFSEIFSYYDTTKAEQFIELYNGGSEQILLDGCKIKYKNKFYELTGIVKSENYITFYPSQLGFSLTKNPTNSNVIELVDVNDTIVDRLTYYNGQRKGTAYAFIGYDKNGEEIWKTTYAPTPGSANNYQEYKTCEAGKVINEATGNCVKVSAVTEKVCKDGYYLNLLTGRCRKIQTKTTTEKTCKEGYYLNPDTGRCRKIVENTGADYTIQREEYAESSSFIALYAILGVIGIGLIYLVYEFRHEIKKNASKLIDKILRR